MRTYHVVLVVVLFFQSVIFAFDGESVKSNIPGQRSIQCDANENDLFYKSLLSITNPEESETASSKNRDVSPVEQFNAAHSGIHPRLRKYLPFYEAIAYRASGNHKQASSAAKKAWESGDRNPEVLSLMSSSATVRGINALDRKNRYSPRSILPLLLPVSFYTRAHDMEANKNLRKNPSQFVFTLDHKPPLPSPSLFQGNHIAIAKLYERMELNRLAVNNFLEAIYYWGDTKKVPERSEYWLEIARIEESAGQEELALRAYLQCLRSNKYENEAVAGIQRIIDGKRLKTRKSMLNWREPSRKQWQDKGVLKIEAWEKTLNKPGWDVDIAKRIAQLHKESNVHPLGIQALYACQKATGVSLQKEIDELTKDWNRIIGYYIENKERRNEYQFYGVKVPADDDWTKVKIKRPSDTFWVPVDLEKKDQ